MGWSSLSVAMTYIHTSEDRVLEAFSGLQGGTIGGTVAESNQLLAGADDAQTIAGLAS
jgi:hypothetical protein